MAFGLTGLLVLAALALRLYTYAYAGVCIPVTSDEAITLLQAKDILRGHFPLLMAGQPYMFPIEAYLTVPLVWLPRTAYGLRVLLLLEGAALVLLTVAILRSMGAFRRVWPGLLLALFPSAYVVMLQAGYAPPHYHSSFILSLAAMLLVLKLDDGCSPLRLLVSGAGIGWAALLAFSNSMMALPFTASVLMVALFRVRWKCLGYLLPGLAAGAAAGLAPYRLAMRLFPGAHQAVSNTRSASDALRALWSPTLKYTLPVTFGIEPTLYPDASEKLEIGAALRPLFPYVFAGVMLLLLGLCLYRQVRSLRRNGRPRMGDVELVFGVSFVNILLFTLNKRADSSSYRYLLPAVLMTPFMFAILYRASKPRLRAMVGGLAVLLAAYNLYAAALLPRQWAREGFDEAIVSAPSLDEAIRFLDDQGIRHAVASHWAAYRVTFLTDERILCSQPFNERFPGWHVPYKAEVDASTNVAYVLTDAIRFLKPGIFERHLRTMGVTARVYTAGAFRVYHAFQSTDARPVEALPSDAFAARASANDEAAFKIRDGDPATRWQSHRPQATGMWLQIDFEQPQPLARLVMDYHTWAHDMPPALDVLVRREDRWERVRAGLPNTLDKFRFENGHPIYGAARRTISFDGRPVRGVRLEVAKPDPRWNWSVAEITCWVEHAGRPAE